MINHKFIPSKEQAFGEYKMVQCEKCEYCAAFTLADALKIFIGGNYHVKERDFIILYKDCGNGNQVYAAKTYGCLYTDEEHEIRKIIK